MNHIMKFVNNEGRRCSFQPFIGETLRFLF